MAANRIFDDFAKLMTDATGAAQGVRREIETTMKAQVERFIRDMDIATREEVEVLRDQLATLRADNARLAQRLSKLEGERGGANAAGQGAAPANDLPGN
jgi:BMFP domain-containing protein YqiC